METGRFGSTRRRPASCAPRSTLTLDGSTPWTWRRRRERYGWLRRGTSACVRHPAPASHPGILPAWSVAACRWPGRGCSLALAHGAGTSMASLRPPGPHGLCPAPFAAAVGRGGLLCSRLEAQQEPGHRRCRGESGQRQPSVRSLRQVRGTPSRRCPVRPRRRCRSVLRPPVRHRGHGEGFTARWKPGRAQSELPQGSTALLFPPAVIPGPVLDWRTYKPGRLLCLTGMWFLCR